MSRNFTAASSQYLYSNLPILGATARPCTFHCWFLPVTATDNGVLMMSLTAGTTNWRQLGLRSSDGKLGAQERELAGASGIATSTGVLTNGVWAACGAVWTSAASRTVWLNGAKDTNTDAVALTDSFDTFRIGGQANYATGDIAEAAAWNVGLDDAEMVALAKGYSPDMIRPAAHVAYWKLFGNAASEADYWKNKYDLAIVNAPAKAAHPRIYYPTGAF